MRCVVRFDDEVVEQLVLSQAEHAAELDARDSALDLCFERLPAGDREMLRRRYGANRSRRSPIS